MKACYMCEAPKTSDEHVPPKCLFPEQKDSPDGKDYRKNLITVPSCDIHNSAKSQEDEYFLMYMATNAFANQAASLHQNTKLLRTLDYNPRVWAMFLEQSSPAQIVGSDGKIHNTCAFNIDANLRINSDKHPANYLCWYFLWF
jgi:hypothetical protein